MGLKRWSVRVLAAAAAAAAVVVLVVLVLVVVTVMAEAVVIDYPSVVDVDTNVLCRNHSL